MSESQNSMDVLNALMEERNRYEQWLAQLEARKGSTPPHVFDRVRGDYGARLEHVFNQLAGRATELQETAGALAERVASLFADESTLRDERAEAELRAAVGEFTEEHAREVMERCDNAIATLHAERETVGAELGRVQEILAVATRPVTPPAQESVVPEPIIPIESLAPPEREVVPEAPVVTPAVPEPEPAATSAPAPQPAPAPFAGFDELAFLQSVVDRPAPAPAPEIAGSPGHLPMPAPELRTIDRATPTPEPMEARTLTAAPPAAPAPSRRPAAPTPILTSAPLIEKEGQDTTGGLTPGSIPAFLKDVPTEQIKTLKCQECGTMNYPTEWYCERCGGELAAM